MNNNKVPLTIGEISLDGDLLMRRFLGEQVRGHVALWRQSDGKFCDFLIGLHEKKGGWLGGKF